MTEGSWRIGVYAAGVLLVLGLAAYLLRAEDTSTPTPVAGLQATAQPPSPAPSPAATKPSTAKSLTGGVARTPEQLAACRAEESQRAAEEARQSISPPSQPVLLRSEARNLTLEGCAALARQWNFYSSENRDGCFINTYQRPREKIVTDLTTGLSWQSLPSPRPLPISEVEPYLKKLNSERFGGFEDWRLPTLEEAFSLMESVQFDDTHVDNVLFVAQSEWWTSDFHTAEKSQWVLFTPSASCLLVTPDKTSEHYVRAVRSSP